MFLSDINIVILFRHHEVLCTVSKSDFSIFYDMSDLGVDKHNTNAEDKDIVGVQKGQGRVYG